MSVSVFAFDACCAPVVELATTSSAGHEEECPMKHEDGSTCPMHRTKPKDAPCGMRAACHEDVTSLAAVFINNAVPKTAFVLRADESASSSLVTVAFARPQSAPAADTPPPRF
jgi:hypothetical protein